MRLLASIALLAVLACACAVPITPSAVEHQLHVEQMRSEGMSELEIAKKLSLPDEVAARPLLSQLTDKLHLVFQSSSDDDKRDPSGDIPPGSLEGPEMLPRAAAPESLAERISETIGSVLKAEDIIERRRFGYEGKELEMRRPRGMRHWDI